MINNVEVSFLNCFVLPFGRLHKKSLERCFLKTDVLLDGMDYLKMFFLYLDENMVTTPGISA